MAAVRPTVWYHDLGRYEELRDGDTMPSTAATQIWSGGNSGTVFTASTPAIRCGGAG